MVAAPLNKPRQSCFVMFHPAPFASLGLEPLDPAPGRRPTGPSSPTSPADGQSCRGATSNIQGFATRKSSQAVDAPLRSVQRDPRSLPKRQCSTTVSLERRTDPPQNPWPQQTMHNFVQTTEVLCVLAFN